MTRLGVIPVLNVAAWTVPHGVELGKMPIFRKAKIYFSLAAVM
jgi:hypothetical protein